MMKGKFIYVVRVIIPKSKEAFYFKSNRNCRAFMGQIRKIMPSAILDFAKTDRKAFEKVVIPKKRN